MLSEGCMTSLLSCFGMMPLSQAELSKGKVRTTMEAVPGCILCALQSICSEQSSTVRSEQSSAKRLTQENKREAPKGPNWREAPKATKVARSA